MPENIEGAITLGSDSRIAQDAGRLALPPESVAILTSQVQ
jgi:hypothetical protein